MAKASNRLRNQRLFYGVRRADVPLDDGSIRGKYEEKKRNLRSIGFGHD